METDQHSSHSRQLAIRPFERLRWHYLSHGLRTPNEPFSRKYRTFGLGQTNWADKFWSIWGILSQTTYQHTVSSLSMFSIIQPLFVQKTKSLYIPHPKYLGLGFEFGPQRIRDLAFVCL